MASPTLSTLTPQPKSVLSGSATGVPKLRDGRVEAIRALRVARSSAIKGRSQATSQIKTLIITGSPESANSSANCRRPRSSPAALGYDPDTSSSVIRHRPPRPRCVDSPAGTNSSARRSLTPTATSPNNALYIIVINRLRYDPRSRAYAERRTDEGLSKPEIIRCLNQTGRFTGHCRPLRFGEVKI